MGKLFINPAMNRQNFLWTKSPFEESSNNKPPLVKGQPPPEQKTRPEKTASLLL
jgi:hypothetical protein